MTQFGKRLVKGLEEAVVVAKGKAQPAKIYRSVGVAMRNRVSALAAVHETALGLADAGVIGKRTMKEFDEICLTPVEQLSAVQIRRIRAREKASQAVFARYLNVTTGLIGQWERGEKAPARRGAEVADAGGEEGVAGGGVTGARILSPYFPAVRIEALQSSNAITR